MAWIRCWKILTTNESVPLEYVHYSLGKSVVCAEWVLYWLNIYGYAPAMGRKLLGGVPAENHSDNRVSYAEVSDFWVLGCERGYYESNS